jgi:hypothetical protein
MNEAKTRIAVEYRTYLRLRNYLVVYGVMIDQVPKYNGKILYISRLQMKQTRKPQETQSRDEAERGQVESDLRV